MGTSDKLYFSMFGPLRQLFFCRRACSLGNRCSIHLSYRVLR